MTSSSRVCSSIGAALALTQPVADGTSATTVHAALQLAYRRRRAFAQAVPQWTAGEQTFPPGDDAEPETATLRDIAITAVANCVIERASCVQAADGGSDSGTDVLRFDDGDLSVRCDGFVVSCWGADVAAATAFADRQGALGGLGAFCAAVVLDGPHGTSCAFTAVAALAANVTLNAALPGDDVSVMVIDQRSADGDPASASAFSLIDHSPLPCSPARERQLPVVEPSDTDAIAEHRAQLAAWHAFLAAARAMQRHAGADCTDVLDVRAVFSGSDGAGAASPVNAERGAWQHIARDMCGIAAPTANFWITAAAVHALTLPVATAMTQRKAVLYANAASQTKAASVVTVRRAEYRHERALVEAVTLVQAALRRLVSGCVLVQQHHHHTAAKLLQTRWLFVLLRRRRKTHPRPVPEIVASACERCRPTLLSLQDYSRCRLVTAATLERFAAVQCGAERCATLRDAIVGGATSLHFDAVWHDMHDIINICDVVAEEERERRELALEADDDARYRLTHHALHLSLLQRVVLPEAAALLALLRQEERSHRRALQGELANVMFRATEPTRRMNRARAVTDSLASPVLASPTLSSSALRLPSKAAFTESPGPIFDLSSSLLLSPAPSPKAAAAAANPTPASPKRVAPLAMSPARIQRLQQDIHATWKAQPSPKKRTTERVLPPLEQAALRSGKPSGQQRELLSPLHTPMRSWGK
jgi:hypothetical protein